MSRLLRSAVATIILGIFIPVHSPAAAPPKPPAAADGAAISPARAAAQAGISRMLAILQDRNLDQQQRADKMRVVVEDMIDFDTLSRLSIGPGWKDLSDAQRGHFVDEFKKHMLGIATKSTKGYDDEEVVIVGDRPEVKGDATILTRVLGRPKDGVQEEIAKVDFRMRQKDDRWKVIDIHIAGISMANTFRVQFLVIMKDGGMDKLLKMLHDKNAASGGEKPTRTADADK
jgi:phospholipid transport system substrate-binding protein